jgi:hypothetical protein
VTGGFGCNGRPYFAFNEMNKLAANKALQSIKAAKEKIWSVISRPARALKAAKTRMLRHARRKRNFLVLAIFAALPELFGAISTTFKIFTPSSTELTVWLLRVAAALAWLLFILSVISNHWFQKKWDELRARRQK